MKKLLGLFGAVLSAAVVSQVFSVSELSAQCVHRKQPDRVVQIAPFERLAQGGYDGNITVSQVKQMSNFGIGTFTGLDGEMIMLDGVVYHAPSSGLLHVGGEQEIIPFATLTRFRGEYRFAESATLADYPALQSYLTSVMPDTNQVVAFKVKGTFSTLKLRAPQKQEKPYPVLTEALKTQAVFDLTNVSGTLVGFRHPTYFGTINASGYHFHFVSDNRKMGGHVLAVSTTAALSVAADTIEQYDVTFGPAD